jgi:hypothetical protein
VIEKMKIKRMAATGIVVLMMSALGGVALANSSSDPQNTQAVSEAPTAADADSVQEGDQTTPDTGAEAKAEAAGETESETESGTESDGPGGHEDPPGNVDHEFDGEE